MELLNYIKDLLLKNDYVILPGLGVFSGHYKPAEIHEENFSPPCKTISFDKNLKYNDNLLTDCIVKNEGISRTEASNKINQSVKNIIYRLGEGDKIEIPDIGILQYDLNGNLYFTEQVKKNFNISSFGMPSFRIESSTHKEEELKKIRYKYWFWKKYSTEKKIPVQKKKVKLVKKNIPEEKDIIKNEKNPVKDEIQGEKPNQNKETISTKEPIQNKKIVTTKKNIPMSEPIQKKETSPTKNPVDEKENVIQKKSSPKKEPFQNKETDSKGMKLLKILLLLAVAIVIALIINKELDKKYDNKLPVKEMIIVPAQPQDSLARTEQDSLTKTEKQIVVKKDNISDISKKSNSQTALKPEMPSSSDASYFIIGGVFKSHLHAVKYMDEMKAKGFTRLQDMNFVRDLHYVTIDQFSTLKDAETARKKILTEDPKSGVWIYKKN